LTSEIAGALRNYLGEGKWRFGAQDEWKRYREVSSLREHAFTVTLDRLLQGRSVSDYGAPKMIAKISRPSPLTSEIAGALRNYLGEGKWRFGPQCARNF
jgi:hypothetical protein